VANSLGKGDQIKTLRVDEGNRSFDIELNEILAGLGDAEIIQIQTHVYQNADFPNYTFMSALIIYKEAE
jgi:hypothetical protein